MADKKPKDYTNSAVNLCNPPELKTLLTDLARLKYREAIIEAKLHQAQLYRELEARQKDIAQLQKTIREAIDASGSYQDLDAGDYAIKQRKRSITYVPGLVREFIRDFADTVIEEVVNKAKLESLCASKLITQGGLDRCAVVAESFSYIINTADVEVPNDAIQTKGEKL